MVIAEPILPGNFADLESGELSEMVRKRIEQGLL
jgi:hypothetical protein